MSAVSDYFTSAGATPNSGGSAVGKYFSDLGGSSESDQSTSSQSQPIEVGRFNFVGAADQPETQPVETGKASISQYNPMDPLQTKPNADGLMASGKKAYDGAVATNDRSIPFGTKVNIGGKDYTVEDHMNERFNKESTGKTMFDIVNMGSKDSAKQFGRQDLDYKLYTQPKPTLTSPEVKPQTSQSSVPVSKTYGKPVPNIAKLPVDIAQSVTQAGGSAALTLANKPELGIDPTSPGWQQMAQKIIFGDQPIKSYATRVAEGEQTAKGFGLGKAALPAAFLGTLGGDALNFLGEEGESTKLLNTLAAEKDAGKITDLLVQKGFAKDIAETYAPKIAEMTDKEAVGQALDRATSLQLGTKVEKGIPQTVEDAMTPERLKGIPKIEADEATQTRAFADTVAADVKRGGYPGFSSDLKGAFRDWVNNRMASKVEGYFKGSEFKSLDNLGQQGIFDFQNGMREGKFSDVAKYFDGKYKQLEDAGVDLGYKNNYLPQLWTNTPEQVMDIQRRLGLKPGFTLESVFKNYQEGIKAGLTPKYNSVSDLVQWYEGRANKLLADKGFFDFLTKNGFAQPASLAPVGWKSFDPDLFPYNRVSYNNNVYTGTLKAPPDLADTVNDYLRNSTGPVSKYASVATRLKNVVLATGIPKTGLNVHGMNILVRNTLASENPISGFLTGAKFLLNPNAAERWLLENSDRASFFAKAGMKLSTEDHALEDMTRGGLQGVLDKYGNRLGKIFADPLFKKTVPALKTQYADIVYNHLTQSGIESTESARIAAETSNNMFGGINWEQIGRSKETQNVLRSLILAPDFQESGIRTAGGIVKGILKPNSPEFKAYRTFARNLLLSYAAANAVNKATTGHYMFQNEPGHFFDIGIGETSDGKTRYLRPFGTAVDFIRLPVDVASSIMKGDLSSVPSLVFNRLSIPTSTAAQVVTNVDRFGNPILGKDKFGRAQTPGQQLGGEAQVISAMAIPQAGEAATGLLTGRMSLEQALAVGTGAPVRYSTAAQGRTNMATEQLNRLLGMPADQANQEFATIKAQDPQLASEIEQQLKDQRSGITQDEKGLRALPPSMRAQQVYQKLIKMDPDAANTAYNDYKDKGIITPTTDKILLDLIKNNGQPSQSQTKMSQQGLISVVLTYAKALGTDPATAFNRIFTGQRITKVSNGAIIVQRMPLTSSQKEKEKQVGNLPISSDRNPADYQLDHTIPLELGGSNDASNLKLVPVADANKADEVENLLGSALNSGKITKDKAQQLIVDFKDGKITADDVNKAIGGK